MTNYKNYKKAKYSNVNVQSRTEMITTIVNEITKLYENNIFGLNQYTICHHMCLTYTDIDVESMDLDVEYDFYINTDIMQEIESHVGVTTISNIYKEIEKGVSFIISGNNEMRHMFVELARLIKNLNENAEMASPENFTKVMDAYNTLSEQEL